MRCKEDADFSDNMGKVVLKLFVLFSLAKERRHGYSLLKEFREKTVPCPERKFFGVGRFYSILDSLEKTKLVKSEWNGSAGKRPKKMFSITPAGRKVVLKAKTRFANAMRLFRSVVPEVFSGKIGQERRGLDK